MLVTLITMASFFVGHFCFGGGTWEGLMALGKTDGISVHGTTMAFLTLSMCEVFHSFNMRSLRGSIFTLKGQNKWLWGAGALSLVLTTVVVLVDPIAKIFGMTGLLFSEYLIAMALGFAIIPLVEIVKLIQRRIQK